MVVRQLDEKLDKLYTEIFWRTGRHACSVDPAHAIGFVHLLFCAKNIERIGDHATHIAEAAYHIATGRRPEPERQRLDQSSTMADPNANAGA